MITGVEVSILNLFRDKLVSMTVKEVYLKQAQGHGIHQVRRALEALADKGILFKYARRHNQHVYRLFDPVKDGWCLTRIKEKNTQNRVDLLRVIHREDLV